MHRYGPCFVRSNTQSATLQLVSDTSLTVALLDHSGAHPSWVIFVNGRAIYRMLADDDLRSSSSSSSPSLNGEWVVADAGVWRRFVPTATRALLLI
jgi:hypothetical protein